MSWIPFPKHVASQLLRSIAGFAFPLFAPQMYATMGVWVGE
jgi:hypothetical protein